MTEVNATPATAETATPAGHVRWVCAKDVRAGDVLWFGNPRHTVRIERITQARCNGEVGLHGNNDTWSGFYKPDNRVRISATTATGT